jgi:hypothetical protein
MSEAVKHYLRTSIGNTGTIACADSKKLPAFQAVVMELGELDEEGNISIVDVRKANITGQPLVKSVRYLRLK